MAPSHEIADSDVLPDELTGPTPRRVTASVEQTKGMMALGFAVLIFGAAAIWGSIAIHRQFQVRAALRQSHATTSGTVTELLHGRSSTAVKYTFSVAGASYSGSAEVRLVADPHPPDPILIRYSPANPAINHPDAWEWSVGWDVFPLVFVNFMTCFAALGLLLSCRTRTVLRNGLPVRATVENCVPDKRLYRIEYSFRTGSGDEQAGKSDSNKAMEIGSTVWVLYLPGSPRRNCLYLNASFDVC